MKPYTGSFEISIVKLIGITRKKTLHNNHNFLSHEI